MVAGLLPVEFERVETRAWEFRGSGQGGGDGLLGGGGVDGIADRLGIIDFLNELNGPKDVVYCLDITASMVAAGMKKLPLAVNALKDSVMMLGDEDKFNIVTFLTRQNL